MDSPHVDVPSIHATNALIMASPIAIMATSDVALGYGIRGFKPSFKHTVMLSVRKGL